MAYLRDHWRGRHTLAWAFWVNTALPFVLIAMGEPWIRPSATDGTVMEAVLASFYIVLGHGVVLPWQIVGLWRSSRRHLEERGDLIAVTFAQGAVLVALVTAAGATTTTVQRIFGFGTGADRKIADAQPSYALKILADDRTVLIDGAFDLGLSRDLGTLLSAASGIEGIVLNSDGGRVFEARGVARQILEGNLDTYVFEHCRSACTIAFVAGRARKLGHSARLGFHSYRLDGLAALINPLDEQAKDRAFFQEQGVSPAFVTRAFATPHDAMWHPGIDHLLGAGVVHQIVEDR
ncbi:MAG: hypothetical protein ACR2P3_01345 [Geminicoccaceae bacterium]